MILVWSVPALGGAPGVYSARYAGPNASDAACVQKLLREMQDLEGEQRRARFVCVIAMARQGRALAIVSDFVEGRISEAPHGAGGLGLRPDICAPGLAAHLRGVEAGRKKSIQSSR